MASEKNWQRLCAIDELAGGGLKRFEVAGIVVLATRVNDTARVIPPFCPHMAEPLIESGICSGATLTCSKHLWQWNLESAEMQGAAEKPLIFYPSEERDGELWIDASQELSYQFDEEDDDDFEW